MSLTPGTRLGPYAVTAKIGEGGMGEVWQARDVALKVPPEAFTSDPDRLARFEREAKILASLNHPNIAQIHGVEESKGTRALVLELVEGPTLADRIKQGPIPLDEALPVAKQIAEALEAAHEQGVIHRDLKPANIKVREDGTVKVLDFGLAKAMAPLSPWGEDRGEGDDLSQSPTVTAVGTQQGVILGTAAYMSPEQARGKSLDKRADIWSFGCVLFEMLAGRSVFGGDTLSDTIANVLERGPQWETLPEGTPPAIRKLLRRCLDKDPRRRLRDIGEARVELEEVTRAPIGDASEPVAASPRQIWERPLWITLLVSVTAAVVGLAVWSQARPESPALMRFTIVPAESAPFGSSALHHDLVISPDGTHVVYNGPDASGSVSQLYVHPIDRLAGEPLRGGEGGVAPFVSADSQWVGFLDASNYTTLKKVSIFGGPATTVTESPRNIFGATWGVDDQIIFG